MRTMKILEVETNRKEDKTSRGRDPSPAGFDLLNDCRSKGIQPGSAFRLIEAESSRQNHG